MDIWKQNFYGESMIASLTGIVLHKEHDHIVLDVQGVGYEVFVPAAVLLRLPAAGQKVRLEIHTHMSDSQLHLHGFETLADKQVFKRLLSVSGIGPKLASSMLAALPYAELVQAIVLEDIAKLKAISGVGPKTAQRVVMELKDKFKETHLDLQIVRKSMSKESEQDYDVIQALLTLGYSDMQARKALRSVDRLPEDSLQTLIKKSLGNLAS